MFYAGLKDAIIGCKATEYSGIPQRFSFAFAGVGLENSFLDSPLY
jgi:hypothetical protein